MICIFQVVLNLAILSALAYSTKGIEWQNDSGEALDQFTYIPSLRSEFTKNKGRPFENQNHDVIHRKRLNNRKTAIDDRKNVKLIDEGNNSQYIMDDYKRRYLERNPTNIKTASKKESSTDIYDSLTEIKFIKTKQSDLPQNKFYSSKVEPIKQSPDRENTHQVPHHSGVNDNNDSSVNSVNIPGTEAYSVSNGKENENYQQSFFYNTSENKNNRRRILRKQKTTTRAPETRTNRINYRKSNENLNIKGKDNFRNGNVEKNILYSRNENVDKLFDDLEKEFKILQRRGHETRTEYKNLIKSTTESVTNYPEFSGYLDTTNKYPIVSDNIHELNNRKERKPHDSLTKNEHERPIGSNFDQRKKNYHHIVSTETHNTDFPESQYESIVQVNNDDVITKHISMKSAVPDKLSNPDALNIMGNERPNLKLQGIPMIGNDKTTPVIYTDNNTVTSTERNYNFPSEYIIPAVHQPHKANIDDIQGNNFKINKEQNLHNMNDNKENSNYDRETFQNKENSQQLYKQRVPGKVLDIIQTEKTPVELEYDDSSYLKEGNIRKKNKDILDAQAEEDEIRIQNAKYDFASYQTDGISDLLHDRKEKREGGKVTGSYAYSDGFFLRRVKYIADKKGYRIISEETLPLPGNGPQTNPKGVADIKTDLGGHPIHYVVHGEDLTIHQRNSLRLRNMKF